MWAIIPLANFSRQIGQKGFSLIEVGIAVGVTGIGVLIAAQMFTQLSSAKNASQILSDMQLMKTQISLLISDHVKCSTVFGYNSGLGAAWSAPQKLTTFGQTASGAVNYVGSPAAGQNTVNLYVPNSLTQNIFLVGSSPGVGQNKLGETGGAQITNIQVVGISESNATDANAGGLPYVLSLIHI